ncbi:heterokaryon incompatibility protein-domain-containing protein [Hypoxylon crocopeplum]|nr:heterokaryon incompatibility protein-domain-containing protein [Hypoxylon crocopeplum]
MHESWDSLHVSIKAQCPICHIVWRNTRPAPFAVIRPEKGHFTSRWLRRGNLQRDPRRIEIKHPNADGDDCCTMINIIRRVKSESPEHPIDPSDNEVYDRELGLIRSTPLSKDMMSQSSLAQIHSWLETCIAGHTACSAHLEAAAKLGARSPTRLIDLQGPQATSWSLVITADNPTTTFQYVALSHRWTADIPKLTQAVFGQLKSGQSDDTLPKDYQHVMALCRALSVRYLWIDSLCIFQDSPEDFRREAATMANVYTGSLFTISICWPSKSGCIRTREPSAMVPKVLLPTSDGDQREVALLVDNHQWVRSVSFAPVNSRGWVFQERALSPRILYLGNEQYYWECDSLTACEIHPRGMPRKTLYSDPFLSRAEMLRPGELNRRLNFSWPKVVDQYTRTALTFQKDKIIALSGVARQIASTSGDEYVAGLWKSRLFPDLLWSPYNDGKQQQQPSTCYAPSWSWAATSDHVNLADIVYNPGDDTGKLMQFGIPHMKPLAQIIDTCVVPSDQDVFGDIRSATIDLTCLLIPAEAQDCPLYPEQVSGRTSEHPHRYSSKTKVVSLGRWSSDQESEPEKFSLDRSGGFIKFSSPYDQSLPYFLVPLVHTDHVQVGTLYRVPPAMHGLVIQLETHPENRQFRRIGMFSINIFYVGTSALLRALIVNTLLKLVPAGRQTAKTEDGNRDDESEKNEEETYLLFVSRLRAFLQTDEVKGNTSDPQAWVQTDDWLDARWSTVRLV